VAQLKNTLWRVIVGKLQVFFQQHHPDTQKIVMQVGHYLRLQPVPTIGTGLQFGPLAWQYLGPVL